MIPRPDQPTAAAGGGGEPGAARRRARVVIGLIAASVVAAAAVIVAERAEDPRPDPAESAGVRLHGDPGDVSRESDGLEVDGATDRDGGSTTDESGDAAPLPSPPEGADPEPSVSGPTGRSRARTGPFSPAATTDDGEISAGNGDAGGRPNPSTGLGDGLGDGAFIGAPPAAQPPPPLYLPGAEGDAPVLGPIAPRDDADDETDDDEAPTPVDPLDVRPSDAEPPPAHTPEPPDPDEVGCPNLNLYPIGGYSEGAPQSFVSLSAEFRALAPEEWKKPTLVCAHAMEPWRDLVVQRLVTDGGSDGAIIAAADGSSTVLRISEIEWATYQFRYGGGPIGPNLVGYPVDHMQLGGVHILRTTAGGLVFQHPEAMGVPLIGGSWDLWVAQGGPQGPMGLPTGRPESAVGPIGADVWAPGLPSSGARQEFTNGWLFLPGVLTDVEAAAQPADRYQWHDASELSPEPAEPFDYRGHIMQISGISFYVDADGIRHWIPSTSQWSCAHWDLGAVEYSVRGHELARYELGSEFVCADFKD